MAGLQRGAGEDEATQLFPGQDAVIVTQIAEPPGQEPQSATEFVPPHPATEFVPRRPATEVAAPHPETQVAAQAAPAQESTMAAAPGQAAGRAQMPPPPPTTDAISPNPVAGIVRYGPGVPVVLPVSQGGRTAEHVWQGGPAPAPPQRSSRLRRLGGSALTLVLLAASGVLLFLRFYHPPFQVTGAAITQRTVTGCRVDVTARIATNGAAGTVAYQWRFEPASQQATTLSQSATRGQHAVDVTVALEGSGQGSASQTAILQVLSPDRRTASTRVTLSC